MSDGRADEFQQLINSTNDDNITTDHSRIDAILYGAGDWANYEEDV